MLAAAALIAAVTLLLATWVPAHLARARWPMRAPSPALVLWQALGLTAGLLALETCLLVALAPSGDDVVAALRELDLGSPWWSWAAALTGLGVFGRLLWVLVRSAARTMRERRRHRVLLDLLATRNPLLRDTLVVDHDVPVAYCLPGLRSRVVVSRGVLTALDEAELRAVLAHERAHLAQRHDLVVLPFVALGSTFPGLPAVVVAREQVLLLVEVLADDRAARRHDPRALAGALRKVGSQQTPAGGLAVTGSEVLLRVDRLLRPPPPLPRSGVVAVLAAAALLLTLPAAGLVLPLGL